MRKAAQAANSNSFIQKVVRAYNESEKALNRPENRFKSLSPETYFWGRIETEMGLTPHSLMRKYKGEFLLGEGKYKIWGSIANCDWQLPWYLENEIYHLYLYFRLSWGLKPRKAFNLIKYNRIEALYGLVLLYWRCGGDRDTMEALLAGVLNTRYGAWRQCEVLGWVFELERPYPDTYNFLRLERRLGNGPAATKVEKLVSDVARILRHI